MFFLKNRRTACVFLLLTLWMVMNTLTRSVLFGMACWELPGSAEGWMTVLSVYAWGTLNDFFTFFFLALPLIPICLLPCAFWIRRMPVVLVFWLYASLMLFTAVAEYLFWEEFHSRFNFIAVDYLIYTTEVLRNILESYPVLPILACLFVCSTVVTLFSLKTLHSAKPVTERNWKCIAVLLLGILSAFFYSPVTPSSPIPRELASNGIWSLFSAWRHNQLDYRQFYPVIDNDTAGRHVHALLNAKNVSFLSRAPEEWRRFVSSARTRKDWNVIQIVVESLGSNLLGPDTPNLSQIIPQSLFLSNLRATGTRTVRGIEALTLSLPPTPGASIVRRPGCEGLFSTGTVFRGHSYDTAFIYGGYGYFDNMNTFFAGNGFRIVDRSSFSRDEITFSTAWGVCDEDLFNVSLREADVCFQENKPFYQFVLTTSNHRPFTYPPDKVSIASGTGRKGAVQYTDYAIGEFLKKASRRSWFKKTLFVITGDHTSGAAGRTDLPPSRYLIPCIFYSPGNVTPGSIDTLCSQIDVAPTLFDLMGWSYRSRFFGRSILDMPREEGRAWIGTYQLLGYLTTDSMTELAPLREPVVQGWNSATGRESGQLPAERKKAALLDALSSYQKAHDLFTSGALRE